MKRQIKQNTAGLKLRVFVLNSTTGAGLTGLAYNTAGLLASYFRDGDTAATVIALAAGTAGTWSSGGFVAVDATNMPGVYEIGVPNAALTVNGTVQIMLQGAANMAPCAMEMEITAVDNQNATTGGLGALPNAAASAAGGLLTRGAGAGQLNPDGTGAVPIAFGTALTATPAANTVGEALLLLDARRGRINTAQAGSGTTITLDAGASAIAGAYVGDAIFLYGGTGGGLPGTGQHRTIIAYNTTTKVATVNRAWDTNPTNTTTFITLPSPLANVGLVNSVAFNGSNVPVTAQGTGPNVVNLTVTNSSSGAIQSAMVDLEMNSVVLTGLTNNSGGVAFSLLGGTYNVSIAAAGYTYTPTTLAVSTNPTTATLVMTAIYVAPASNPGQTNAWCYTYDAQGNIMSHVLHQFQLVSPVNGDVRGNTFNVSSDNNGLLQVTLLQNQSYQFRRGTGSWVPFSTGTVGTFVLPSLLGTDAS